MAGLEQLAGGQHYDILKVLAPEYQPETLNPIRLDDWTDRARKQNLKVQAQRYQTQLKNAPQIATTAPEPKKSTEVKKPVDPQAPQIATGR